MSNAITKVLPAGYGLVALSASATGFLLAFQSVLVGNSRKAAKIAYPQLYATPEEQKASRAALVFNCTQRAHQNTLEVLPYALFATLWTGLSYPRFAAGAMGLWLVGRVAYTIGYRTGDPAKRQYGSVGSVAFISMIFGATYTSYRVIMDSVL